MIFFQNKSSTYLEDAIFDLIKDFPEPVDQVKEENSVCQQGATYNPNASATAVASMKTLLYLILIIFVFIF